MPLFDSADLLDTIKHRGSVATNAGSWDDGALLKAASEVILTWHLPLLVAAKGEYLVKETQMPTVYGQREYLISYRAAAVRLLSYLGNDNIERPLDELTPRAQSELYVDRGRLGFPLWFSFREGYAQLFPLPMNTTDKLKVLWHISPSRLCLTTGDNTLVAAAQITARADAGGNTTLTFNSAVGTPMGGASGTLYDFVGMLSPFAIKGFDIPSNQLTTGGVSTTMRFATAVIPTDLNVGDWVCQQGYTAMPNIPKELHVPVALRTAAIATGSRESSLANTLSQEASALERNLLTGILQPRSKGNPRKLVQRRWLRR